jgi:hypothetical protein
VRERRARERAEREKKKAAPAATEHSSPPSDAIRFLAALPVQRGRWNLEVWALDPESEHRWLLWGSLEQLPRPDVLTRILDLVLTHRVRVVVMSLEDVVWNLSSLDPEYAGLIVDAGAKVLHAITSVEQESEAVRDLLSAAYGSGMVHLLDDSYSRMKLQQLRGGTNVDALLADCLGELHRKLIPHTAAVLVSRRQLEEELEREAAGHRVAAAVVKRGRMFNDLGDYSTPDPTFQPIPAGHPALYSESWIGSISPHEKRIRLPWKR